MSRCASGVASHPLDQLAHAKTIDRIAQFYFGFDLITFRHRHLPHVVTQPAKLTTLPVVPATGRSQPNFEAADYRFILPMTYHDFPVQSHS